MKKVYLAIALASILLLAGCGNAPTALPATTDSTFSLGQTYTIWAAETSQENVYGIVIWDNLKNVFSNIGWFLTYVDCQPGDKVYTDTLIASITPNEDDPTMKNLHLQQALLEAQLENLQATYDFTEQNFEFQKESLSAQVENNQNIYNQDSADLQKLENTIANFKSQQENVVSDALKKVRNLWGKAENTSLYDDLYNQRNDMTDMDDDEFSQYLEDMADLMKKAASYASGDANYSMFMGLTNAFWASKSSFDGLADSLVSAQNAYDNQHDTLWMNLDLVDEQVQILENNKQIQLNVLDSQMQSIEQSLDSLSNSLEGEDVYAWVDGIVKAKIIWADNKVSPNAMICQISPSDSAGKKIQIFSVDKINIGQIVKLLNGDIVVGAAKIQYELPYRDPVTQNYIYEITGPNLKIKEGDRLNVQFFKKVDATEAWIPVSFVFSKLDGNYVRIQNGSGFVETKVELGDINGDLVKVTSGASLGQTIVN